jgi:hypothetical protein
MQWHRSGLLASWQYWEDTPVAALDASSAANLGTTEVKHFGSMVIISSLNVLSSAVSAVLKEATSLSLEQSGNALHVALVGINNPMNNLQDRYSFFVLSLKCPTCWDVCDAVCDLFICLIAAVGMRIKLRKGSTSS